MASAPQMKQAIETTSDDIIMGSSTESHQSNGAIVPEAYTKVVVAIIAVIMIISFIGNILALSAMARTRKNIYPWFFNLALADLIQTVFCMPYSIYLTNFYEDKQTFDYKQISCSVFGYTFHMILLMGLVSNTCVALDRVHATYFPFHYSNQQRRFPAKYKIGVVWLSVALIAAIPFYLQTDKNQYPPFGLQEYIPMCVFDIRNMFDTHYNRVKMDILVTFYYFAIYGIPIILIICSTCLVMIKLFPKVLAERRHNLTAKSLVISNTSAVIDEHALTTLGDDTQLPSKQDHVTSEGCTRYPLSSHDGRAMTSSSDKDLMASEDGMGGGKKGLGGSMDNLVRLHSGTKQCVSKKRKRSQWRAIQTMLIVSISFVLTHLNHVMFWVFDMTELEHSISIPNTKTGGPSMATRIGYTSLKTSQIIMVYVDCVINVMVYYNRCTLIKETMGDQARRFITLATKPLFKLLSYFTR